MSGEICIVCNKREGIYEVEQGYACVLHGLRCNACGKYTTAKTAEIWGYGFVLCSRDECKENFRGEREKIKRSYLFAKKRAVKENKALKTLSKVVSTYFLSNFILTVLTIVGVYLFIFMNNSFRWIANFDYAGAKYYLWSRQVPTILLLGIIAFPVEFMNEAQNFFIQSNFLSEGSVSLISNLILIIGIIISLVSVIVSYLVVIRLTDPWRGKL